jgi:hypothetical protein
MGMNEGIRRRKSVFVQKEAKGGEDGLDLWRRMKVEIGDGVSQTKKITRNNLTRTTLC